MKRDPVWLALCLLALVGCARAAFLLGGPPAAPVTVDCHDGTTCPENYSCPPPGGKCEWEGPGIEMGEKSDASK